MDYLVNQTDYDIWAAHNGMTSGATWDVGDWDADHDVDAADLALWQQNQTGVTSVTISATDAGAAEPSDTGTFTITRTGSTSGALTVNYSISGSATNTSDYSTLGATVVIPNGSASATITVAPINDTLIEGSETAILTVAGGAGYGIGAPSIATVTIADNDVPSITVSATDSAAAEQGQDAGVFTVMRNGSGPALLTGALTVNYSIAGTATNTSDYSTLGTTVMIPNGSALATITVAVIDDTITEPTETVILTVASGTGYTAGSPSAGTVTIADNDSLPGAPGNLTATPGNNTIALSWSAATGNVQGYHIERSRDGGAWSLVQSLASGATNWLDTGRSPVPSYNYRLSAYNASGEGPYSNTAGAHALGVPGDGNGDGAVDATDYAAWFNNYGKSGVLLSDGDFSGDGGVDASDYALWFNNYGVGGSSGAAPASPAGLASADGSRLAPTSAPAAAAQVVVGRISAPMVVSSSIPSAAMPPAAGVKINVGGEGSAAPSSAAVGARQARSRARAVGKLMLNAGDTVDLLDLATSLDLPVLK
jgi:hypothetical protein